MKVLVTGASGFIGREVAGRLCKLGHEVHAVARSSVDIPNAVWHQVDLLDTATVDRLIAEIRPSHLMHFAWTTEPGKFWNSSDNHEWERASRAMFDSFAKHGGRRFIGAGSVAEYEWTGEPCVESFIDGNPATLYGQKKLSTFRYVEQRAQECGIASAWGRIFWLYGPHEHPLRLIPHVITGILSGRAVDCSSGEQLRDFMHVYDVAEGFIKLLESDVVGPVNIASGNPVAVKDIICQIAEALSGQGLVRLGAIPTNSTEPQVVCADVNRLNSEVRFSPEITLSDGLNMTMSWWKLKQASEAVSA